ncbi:hypothetical protein [Methanolobus sp. ZRKC5]|uniref:hypothetical protein n=1 Tax=unclassified Methanolobus TaxID=2629569 RepID=UPI00313D6D38
MFGENDNSGKIMLDLAKELDLLVPIIKLCDETRFAGLKGKVHLKQWRYNGMLRHMGLKIEGKSKGKLKAGELMVKNAKNAGLYDEIIKMPEKAKKIASEKDLKISIWELNGLLNSLGLEIEKIVGTKFPVPKEDQKYRELEASFNTN